MQQFFNKILQFVQQGVASVFSFIAYIWNWAVTEVLRLVHVQIMSLSIWKQAIILITAVLAAYYLYQAAKELIDTFEKLLKAFAAALSVLVTSLTPLLYAIGIIVVGLWLQSQVP